MATMPPPVAKTLSEANEIIARLHAENEALRAENAALRARVAELEARLAELEARVGQNSTNSSRPPSSDAPWSKPKRKPPEESSGRKPGGQPGHPPHVREPVPPEQVARTRDVFPDKCGICGLELPPDVAALDAYEHQVTDLPEIRPEVTGVRLWRKRCPRCRGFTRARLPADVPKGAFGPRLKATVTALTAKYGLSRRELIEAIKDLFGMELSVGAVQAICEEVSEAVAPAVAQVKAEVEKSAAVNADETGWRQKGEMHWLWTAATPDAAFFVLAPDRGHAALDTLFSRTLEGVLMSDRWVAYERFEVEKRQLCHAHLRRDFQAAIDRGGQAKPVGQRLLDESNRMFKLWHAFTRAEMDRSALAAAMEPVKAAWEDAVLAAIESSDRKLAALGADLWNHWDALWTFVAADGVEPTNNEAERTLRPAVTWRKCCFGTQSDRGSQFVARMMTVVQTARRRGVNPLDWLERACRASLIGLAPPPIQA